MWLPLPGDDELDVVYVGTEIFSTPSVTCSPPCILVFPTSSLPSSSVVDAGDYTTSFEYGHKGTTKNEGGPVITTFFTTTTTITIDIPPVTIGGLPYSNYNISQGQTSDTIYLEPSVDIPPIGIPLPDGNGGTTTRTVTLPPWPAVTRGPPEGPGWGNTADDSDSATGVYHTPFVTTITASEPMVTTISFPRTVSPITIACPPDSTVAFNTPKTTYTTYCNDPTSWTFAFSCPATKIVTFLGPSAGVFTADCTLTTVFSPPTTSPPTTTPTDVCITFLGRYFFLINRYQLSLTSSTSLGIFLHKSRQRRPRYLSGRLGQGGKLSPLVQTSISRSLQAKAQRYPAGFGSSG